MLFMGLELAFNIPSKSGIAISAWEEKNAASTV